MDQVMGGITIKAAVIGQTEFYRIFAYRGLEEYKRNMMGLLLVLISSEHSLIASMLMDL